MKEIKTLIIISLCSIILFIVVYFPNRLYEIRHTQEVLISTASNLQLIADFFQLNFLLNNKMTGLLSPNVSISETTNDKKDRFLSDLVYNTPLLLYRYTDINCNACYETELEVLQEEFADTPTLVSVLCSYTIDQHFVAFKKINKLKIALYSIDHKAFYWAAEEYGNPYYFVLHPDLKISHIYVPDKAFPELNRQYLEGVKRFLTNDK